MANTTSRIRLVMMIAVLALVATACASADDDAATATTAGGADTTTTVAGEEPTDTTTAPPPDEPMATDVTLTFQNWSYKGTMKELWDGFIEEFVAENDSVVGVDVELQPFPRYHDVLNVKLAANSPPDVSWLSASVGQQYVVSGRLVDLRPYIEAMEGYNLDDFPAEALAPWMNGDEIVGIPFTNTSNVVFFNTDAFEAAGIPTPRELEEQGLWTWDAMRDAADTLTQSGAVDYGLKFKSGIYGTAWKNMIELYAPYGAQPWSSDGRTCLFDSAEFIEATQLIWDMVYVDGSFPPPSVAADFSAGNIGMSLGRQSLGDKLLDVPFGWDVTVAPSGPEGYRPSSAQNAVVAWKAGQNPGLAAQFVLHATTPEAMAVFTRKNPSARTPLQNLETLQMYPSTGFSLEQIESALLPSLIADVFTLEYQHPFFAAINREVIVAYDGDVWVEDANIPEAMASLCENIDPLLTP